MPSARSQRFSGSSVRCDATSWKPKAAAPNSAASPTAKTISHGSIRVEPEPPAAPRRGDPAAPSTVSRAGAEGGQRDRPGDHGDPDPAR